MIEAKHVKVTLTADALASSISSPYKNVQIRVTCAESPPQYSPVALDPPPNAAWAAMTPDTTPAASQSRTRAAQARAGRPFAVPHAHIAPHVPRVVITTIMPRAAARALARLRPCRWRSRRP